MIVIEIKHERPEVEAYCNLRLEAGMSGKSYAAAEKGLPNALFNVTIYDNSQLIGMGRVIGDGGTAFQVIDVAVAKDYQGKGFGKTIMKDIMDYIKSIAESGTYVSLIADYPADKLYEKFGFKMTEPYSGGMYLKF
ncbi:GNAT family N-acetyltransferase [Staphylococcus sp. ACRSN]|uniref:GNAT family N-acetyltransferase n=1 Tax=Staphylococcus sp. ACRSN TaxID=2918214 RepID=UPI001EF2794C|nr:GNAT family N-acetyltransferase [Staphylococcus sp. ACRSN]MCG7338163.1 GNAT family N-acetyltransferase [Staphylococcus sp. ACRSN]